MSGRLGDSLSKLVDDTPVLDDRAQARIISYVGDAGPGLIRRARRRRLAVRVAAPTLALGAIVAILLPLAQPDEPRCVAWAPVAAAALRSSHSLGTRGAVEVDPNTVGHIHGDDACQTIIDLEAGLVSVRADDLGGGSLLVRTNLGVVSVHGTVFSVERRDDGVRIAVAEGRVAWTATSKQPVYLGANEDLVVSPTAPSIEQDPSTNKTDQRVPAARVAVKRPRKKARRPTAERKEKKPALDSAPSAPTSSILVRRAEAFRRGGKISSAKESYRAAGAFHDRTAEAAWVALAGFELELGRPRAALTALRERHRRFAHGELELESDWIAVRALEKSGERARARQRAHQIVLRWPDSAQAQAARAWIERHP